VTAPVAELRGANDSWLKLQIVGYQFPDMPFAEYDSNWLIIRGDACIGGRTWSFRFPCMLTYEVARLADWLEALSRGEQAKAYCGFIEPNLDFELISSDLLRVIVAHESRPPWSDDQFGESNFIDFPRDPEMLRVAAASLRDALAIYPQRAKR
jgi:hypothetical protein